MSEVRRAYWELVAYRAAGGRLSPLEALLEDPIQGELGDAEVPARFRVAAVVPLPEAAQVQATAELAAHVERELAELGIGLDLWWQLPVELGRTGTRFLNKKTARAFLERGEPLLAALAEVDPDKRIGICLDMEPDERILEAGWHLVKPTEDPWAAVRSTLAGGWALGGNLLRPRAGRSAFEELDRALASSKREVHVAVMPPLLPPRLSSPERAVQLRSAMLGCPSVGAEGRPLFGRQAAMAYTSLLRRAFFAGVDPARTQERAQLESWALGHGAVLDLIDPGAPKAIALGMIGQGVLGTEPVYDDAQELADDVAQVKEHGFADLSFFCLEGILFGPAGVPDDDQMHPTRPDRSRWWKALR